MDTVTYGRIVITTVVFHRPPGEGMGPRGKTITLANIPTTSSTKLGTLRDWCDMNRYLDPKTLRATFIVDSEAMEIPGMR